MRWKGGALVRHELNIFRDSLTALTCCCWSFQTSWKICWTQGTVRFTALSPSSSGYRRSRWIRLFHWDGNDTEGGCHFQGKCAGRCMLICIQFALYINEGNWILVLFWTSKQSKVYYHYKFKHQIWGFSNFGSIYSITIKMFWFIAQAELPVLHPVSNELIRRIKEEKYPPPP